jgi:hypothetical protein
VSHVWASRVESPKLRYHSYEVVRRICLLALSEVCNFQALKAFHCLRGERSLGAKKMHHECDQLFLTVQYNTQNEYTFLGITMFIP